MDWEEKKVIWTPDGTNYVENGKTTSPKRVFDYSGETVDPITSTLNKNYVTVFDPTFLDPVNQTIGEKASTISPKDLEAIDVEASL